MKAESYYYNCSPGYIDSIAPDLRAQITETIEVLPKRSSPSEIDFDLFWLLTSIGWSYAKAPSGISAVPDECLGLDCQLKDIKPLNLRRLCLTTETLENRWYADFGKQFDAGIVQIETQFGKMEALFKELCGFRMAYVERRLALGIEIVVVNPGDYFTRRRSPANGLARFETAKDALTAIGLDCPIWLVGIAA